jgi:hypothetical protein
MEPLFTVPFHLRDGAYAIFYQSAFVTGALLIFYEGYRRKWPLLPWVIVLSSCAVGAIIGSKLAVLSLEELNEAVRHWRLPYSAQKTYLGGILGGWRASILLGAGWSSVIPSSTLLRLPCHWRLPSVVSMSVQRLLFRHTGKFAMGHCV